MFFRRRFRLKPLTVLIKFHDGKLAYSNAYKCDSGYVAKVYGDPVLLGNDGKIESGPCFVTGWYKHSGWV